MSCIIESNRTCTLLDCSDSGLSISSNILGIATFAVAVLLTYFAFFQDIRDIPTAADDYSNDIRSLQNQVWAIGDIHGQLANLVADGGIRISDVHLQSRLKQGQGESLKEAHKFLDDYSQAYQSVFTDYFKKHRWFVRLRWLSLQKRVEHFKVQTSVLRETLTLDLLAISVNLNFAMHNELRSRDTQRDMLEDKVDRLMKMVGRISPEEGQQKPSYGSPDSLSPTAGLSVPMLFVTSPADDSDEERLSRRDIPRLCYSRDPSPMSPAERINNTNTRSTQTRKTRENDRPSISETLAQLQHDKRNKSLLRVNSSTHSISRRPIQHAPIASPFAGAGVQKVVYVSSKTPLMAAVKRVRKFLVQIERRATQDVRLVERGEREGMQRLVEAREKMKKEEVVVKASGRAMAKAVAVGRWFEDKETEWQVDVQLRGGSEANDTTSAAVAVVDVGTIEGGPAGQDECLVSTDNVAESATEPSPTKKKRRKRTRKRRAFYDMDDVPEQRLRWIKTVEVAISFKA
ncbi:hypothetical protein DV736_g5017, partial [Chaetothyriales sp. CBS 134916]